MIRIKDLRLGDEIAKRTPQNLIVCEVVAICGLSCTVKVERGNGYEVIPFSRFRLWEHVK